MDLLPDIEEIKTHVISLLDHSDDDSHNDSDNDNYFDKNLVENLCGVYENLLLIEEKIDVKKSSPDIPNEPPKYENVDLAYYDNFFTSDVVDFLGNQFRINDILNNRHFTSKKFLKVSKRSNVSVTVYNEGINPLKQFGIILGDGEQIFINSFLDKTGFQMCLGTWSKIKFEFFIKTENLKFTTTRIPPRHFYVEQNVDDVNIYNDFIRHYVLTWEDTEKNIEESKFNKLILIITIDQLNKKFNTSHLTNK